MNILNKMERKFGRYHIDNLMLYIVIGTLIVYAFDFLFPDILLESFMTFNRDAVLHGQIWRIVSFVFIPESGNPIIMVFWLYFYWFIGSNLESYWGSFNFNVFYFSGVIFSILSGFITGFATNHYLNLSLFLAMAVIAPNTQLLLFFFIPVKMKWIAWFDAAVLIYDFIPVSAITIAIKYKMPFSAFVTIMNSYWNIRLAILLSLLNFLLFFGGGFFRKIYDKFKYHKVRSNFKKNLKMTKHRDD